MEHMIGVDLGGTRLRAALVERHGAVVAHEQVLTHAEEGPPAVVERIAALIERMRAAMPTHATLVGVGVGSPGPLDPYRGLVLAPPNLPGWDNVPLRDLLWARIGLPVELANDANAAVLGEWYYGGGYGYRNLVYLTISTGIGGGVICDGRLLLGRMGSATEVGYIVIDSTDGKTWEELASGTAIIQAARAAMEAHPESLLHRIATPATVNAGHVFQAARQGDPAARSITEREVRLLGLGLVSMLHLFSPEIVIVGGGVIIGNEELLKQATAVAHRHAVADLYREVPIIAARLGDRAGVMGAAALALQAYEGYTSA
jgi:glucokinase